MDVERNLPKGNKVENSYNVYILLHPGVLRLVGPNHSKLLHQGYNITLQTEQLKTWQLW